MARPRQFDETQAIDAAMHVFWRNGYEATSTQDLCEATGLGRSSIYNTFKSKHDLFTRSLHHYIAITSQQMVELLEAKLPARERIGSLLDLVVRQESDAQRNGCLVIDSIIELGRHDPVVDDILRHNHEYRIAALRVALSAGKVDGSIAADRDVEALAQFIAATIGGMRVVARSGAPSSVMRDIADTAMTAL